MNIIIAGCGKVGYALAQQLNDEGHNITIIDNLAERLQSCITALDVQGIVGNATSFRTQQEAGIEEADLFIAVTSMDETSLLSCLIAKKASNCHTIARVRNPEYFKEISYLRQCMGLSMAINPEFAAAKEIAHLIQIPDAMEVDTFAKGRVDLLKVVISEKSPLHNMKVYEFSKKFNHDLLICILERNHQVIIPNGSTVLLAGDSISAIMPKEKVASFYKVAKLHLSKEARNVMIAGGGTISYYLATMLLHSGIRVRIIERRKERCDFLSIALPNATVICADATNHEIMLEEGLATTDAFVSLTNMDEENVFLSLYASKVNPKSKKITKINRMALDEIIDTLPVGSILDPKHITAEYILQYVRSLGNSYGSNVEALYRLVDNQVEALEFHIGSNSSITQIPLQELQLRSNLLICCIVRKNKMITPSGQDVLLPDDTVIVVTTHKGLQDITDILKSPTR